MISKEMLQAFRRDFNEAMKPLETKYNLELKLSKITYGEDSFQGKVEAFDRSQGESKEANEFNKYCSYYGLQPSDLNRVITTPNGEGYQIKGLDRQKRKYCISAIRVSDGKEFGLTLDFVKKGLATLA